MNSNVNQTISELTWLGQAGFLIKMQEGTIICVDPYLSNSAENDGACVRMWQSGIKLSDMKPNLVICTHDHLDHLDPETIKPLNKLTSSIFAGPDTCCRHFEKLGIENDRIAALNENTRLTFNGVFIEAVHATHTEDSIGVFISNSEISVYITGDTSYSQKLLETLKGRKADILITCINGNWGNLNCDEACQLAKLLEAKAVIPMHYGLFADNTENPKRLLRNCKESGFGGKVFILEPEKPHKLFQMFSEQKSEL